MRRFLTIMLLFTLYLTWGVSSDALSRHSGHTPCPTEETSSGDLTLFTQQHSLLLQCATTTTLYQSRNNVSYTVPGIKAQTQISRTSARQKTECNKIFSVAIHSRRAGHLTHIFEYNHFRSSLRVVYYLHTLCRLRI